MAEGRARESLRVSPEDRARVDALCSSLRRHSQAAAAAAAAAASSSSPSFFEGLALRGIRVLRIRPGFIHCSFTVPNALTVGAFPFPFPFIRSPIFYYIHPDSSHQDSSTGCLAAGAAVALVDEIGSAAAVADAKNLKVSVDMSVSFPDLSQARPGDRLSITARALGHKGAYSATHVLLTNAATAKVVAEGRHSLFGNMKISTLPPPHRSNM